jgi:hypothetical protein
MQAYENKTQRILNQTNDDEPVFALRILITKDKILPFSNYNMRIYSFL